MKKLLFVDDRTKRIRAALKKYEKDYEVHIAPNVPELWRAVNEEYFDVISFDCDLGGIDYIDPDTKDSIFEFIRYLEKVGWPNYMKKPRFVVIHSSNKFAAERLKLCLENWFPGNVFMERFTYDA